MVKGNKEGHYIMMIGSIHQSYNDHIYMPNIGKLKFIKQKLIDLKGEINRTLIPHSQQWTDHLDRINKETPDLNNSMDQKGLLSWH